MALRPLKQTKQNWPRDEITVLQLPNRLIVVPTRYKTATTKEVFVAQDHGDSSPRLRSPIRAAAVLFGIFVAMYLGVAALLRVVTTPDALAAVVPHHSLTVSMPAAASGSEAKISAPASAPISDSEANKAPSDDSSETTIEPKNAPRECNLSLVIDSDCVFD